MHNTVLKLLNSVCIVLTGEMPVYVLLFDLYIKILCIRIHICTYMNNTYVHDAVYYLLTLKTLCISLHLPYRDRCQPKRNPCICRDGFQNQGLLKQSRVSLAHTLLHTLLFKPHTIATKSRAGIGEEQIITSISNILPGCA